MFRRSTRSLRFATAILAAAIVTTVAVAAPTAAAEPTIDTTISIHMTQGGEPANHGYIDLTVSFAATITPWVTGASMTWFASRDGAPEEVLGTSDILGDRSHLNFLGGDGLEPGVYVVRAAWEGAGDLRGSTSTPITVTLARRPMVMTLTANPTDDVAGGGSTLTVMLRRDPSNSRSIPGMIDFYEITGGVERSLGSSALTQTNIDFTYWHRGQVEISGLGVGVRTFEARWAGTPQDSPARATTSITIGPQSSTLRLDVAPNPALATQVVEAAVTLQTFRRNGQAEGGLPDPSGTISVFNVAGGALLGSTTVDRTGSYFIPLPSLPVGITQLMATYSGDPNFDPAESTPAYLEVAPDFVDATATVAYPSFYPYTDGYRDSLGITGMRNEPVSVEVRVYNSGNRVVKSASIARGTGRYTTSWNGRSVSGNLLSAGTYRVVQTLTDAAGTRLAVTRSVTLSHKRLSWRTTYVTKLGSSITAKGDPGAGSVVLSRSGGYARLTAKGSGWVAVGYQFTLPNAAAYRSIAFQVYATGPSTIPRNEMGMQNVARCNTWDVSCFDRWASVGDYRRSLKWYSTSGHATNNRSGRTVRGIVAVDVGTVTIYKARVKVVYGVLR